MKKALLYNLSFFFLFVSSVIIFPAKVNGQPQWTQAQRFGSADVYEIVNSVALDAAGNVYMTGYVNNVVDFGTGPLNTGIYGQAYVAKYSAAGVCLWVTRMNCPENPSSPYPLRPDGMAIATNGTSVYVTGTYGNCLVVNGAPSISGNTAFGLKLDAATGNAQWLTGFGSSNTRPQAVCIDPAGNLYISGYLFTNSFYPVTPFGSFNRSANGGLGYDAFVTRLDGTTGMISWVTSGGTISTDPNPIIDRDNDDVERSGIAYVPELNSVVMTGGVDGTGRASFSSTGSGSTLLLTYAGGAGNLVLQLNASTGASINGVIVNNPHRGRAYSLRSTIHGAVYDPFTKWVVFTGDFSYLDPQIVFGNLPPLTGGDIFYVAYNPVTNNFVWARSATSENTATGLAVTADGLGKIYATGAYRSNIFAATAIRSTSVISNRGTNADEIFLLQLNSLTGYADTIISPQSVNAGTLGNLGYSIAANNTGTVVLAGQLGGTSIFPPLAPVTSAGTSDILLVKYRNAALGPLPVRLQSFTAQRANADITLAWHTAAEIDHDRFEIERSTDGRSFSTVGQRKALGTPGSGNYSWTDLSVASRNSGKVFYRLKMVSTTGQVTYSEIVVVYLDKNNNMLMLAATPNPFTNQLSLNLNLPERGHVRIGIGDMSGRKISSHLVEVPAGFSTMAVTQTANLKKGVYTLTLEHNGQQKVMRIVKQ